MHIHTLAWMSRLSCYESCIDVYAENWISIRVVSYLLRWCSSELWMDRNCEARELRSIGCDCYALDMESYMEHTWSLIDVSRICSTWCSRGVRVRSARNFQSCHSLHHTSRCRQFSNSSRITLSLILEGYEHAILIFLNPQVLTMPVHGPTSPRTNVQIKYMS